MASVDVEWTKNYRVKNGNVPFCWSVVWLAVPDDGAAPVDVAALPWWWSSAYVDKTEETLELVQGVDAVLEAARRAGAQLVGHQLSSDLGVLAAAADGQWPVPGIVGARTAWHARRDPRGRPVLDTRYDTDHLLPDVTSRRLVDVCTALDLDVTQPELRGTSMTKLHRQWLDTRDPQLRERVSVLNLRHSLSTGLVAALATGVGHRTAPVNVNRLLDDGLNGRFDYLTSPTFRALL